MEKSLFFYPDEPVDQFEKLYSEKVRGNDNCQPNKQIIAITDKFIENESITTNQHRNVLSV